jgi:hypothetical protein
MEALRFFETLGNSNPTTKGHIAEGHNVVYVIFNVIRFFILSLIHSFILLHNLLVDP